MLDLNDVQIFLKLTQSLNLTKTALSSNVSVSTISRTLNRLEEDLGVKLCSRETKGLTLTREGHIFEEWGDKTIQSYLQLVQSIGDKDICAEGTITIFCSVTASYIFIPSILNELRLQQPNLQIRLETGDLSDAFERLEQKADFVISALPSQLASDIAYEDLCSYPLVLIGPKSSHNFNTDYKNLDLNNIPFIMPSKGLLHDAVQQFLQEKKIKPHIYSHIAGHEALVSTCALGFGLTIVPSIVYEMSPFKGDIAILSREHIGEFKIAICYQKSRYIEPKIKAVCKVVRQNQALFTSY